MGIGRLFFYLLCCLRWEWFLAAHCYWIALNWENMAYTNLPDNYGQEWSYAQRKNLEYTVYSVYFMTIVVCQVANLIVCKTRRTSILCQGMSNRPLILALFIEVFLTVFLMYTPGLQIAFKFYPIMWHWWLCGAPFMVCMLLFAEGRKLAAHFMPGGLIERDLLF